MPNCFFEFIFENNSWIKNKFTPSNFIVDTVIQEYAYQLPKQYSQQDIQYSIILEFIYNITGCNKERFLYILNWLAHFFQNPGYKLNTALVFVGKDNWAIDFLFNSIITQLFRKEYCLQIDNEILELKGLFNILEEKLFYYFKDIKINTNSTYNLKDLLKNIILEDEFYIDKNKCYPKKFINFAQTIIVTDNPNTPFLNKDGNYYTVFKSIPLGKEIINKIIANSTNSNNMHFKEILLNDIENFSNILKLLQVDKNLISKSLENDDRNILIKGIDDKIKSFSKAIIGKNINFFTHIKHMDNKLYEEIVSNFEKDIFMQPNLIKCFNILYPEEEGMKPKFEKDKKYKTRTLMKILKKIDGDFFSKENIFVNSTGLKYFKYCS